MTNKKAICERDVRYIAEGLRALRSGLASPEITPERAAEIERLSQELSKPDAELFIETLPEVTKGTLDREDIRRWVAVRDQLLALGVGLVTRSLAGYGDSGYNDELHAFGSVDVDGVPSHSSNEIDLPDELVKELNQLTQSWADECPDDGPGGHAEIEILVSSGQVICTLSATEEVDEVYDVTQYSFPKKRGPGRSKVSSLVDGRHTSEAPNATN